MSSRGKRLRALVSERLTAAAEEIFALVEKTIAEYEEELCRYKEENQRRQQLLEEAEGGPGSHYIAPVQGAAGDLSNEEEQFTVKDEPEEHSLHPLGDFFCTSVYGQGNSDPQVECTVLREGSAVLQGESAVLQGGSAVLQGGSVILQGGSVILQEGSVVLQEGSAVLQEGSVVLQEGTAVFQEESAIVQEESAIVQEESAVVQEESAVVQEESAVVQEELTDAVNENLDGWTEPWEPLTSSDAEYDEEKQNCTIMSTGCSEEQISRPEFTSKVRRNICPICGKTFKRDLRSHMLVHTGERPFSCSVCHKGFTRKSSLSLHMKLHLDERPFRCSVCQKEFVQKSNYTVHIKRHAKSEIKQRQMQCSTNQKQNEAPVVSEELHVATESKEPTSERGVEHGTLQARGKRKSRVVCEVSRSSQSSAQRRTPGDRGEECPVCGKRFHDLWPHMRLHTGERPYRCSVCRKGFPRRSSLTLHKRLHMQEKPYKCSLCDKAFTQNINFKRHMEKHGRDGDTLQPVNGALSGVYHDMFFT